MDLEQQLRAALVPVRPEPQLRAAVMARLAARSRRRAPNRWVLTGVVFALAAAAAMLAIQRLEPDTHSVADPSPAGAALRGDAHDAPVSLGPVAAGVEPEKQGAEARPAASAVKPFTVQMVPLQSEVTDESRKAAIAAVYAAFVDGLRAVPGLVLVEPVTDGSQAPVSAEYRLTVEGGAFSASAGPAGDFVVTLTAQRLMPDGQPFISFHSGMVGRLAPGCASPASVDVLAGDLSCADSVGIATTLLAILRKQVFPPDPQLQQRLQARLLDQGLDPAERFRALVDLGSFGRISGQTWRFAIAPILREPAVVRAAIQLASTTPDPAARAQVWYLLRGSRDAALVRPLVATLQSDADDDSRLQALGTLAADFATNPQVRAALETAAEWDSDPLIRVLAQRELGEVSRWTEYVLASLKDDGRTPVERVEALFYAYGLPTSRMYGSLSADGSILRTLDDEAVRTLAAVLPKAAAESQRYAQASLTLVSELASREHPAITELLLDGLSATGSWLDRGLAIRTLGSRHFNDPRVRAALEKIAAEDADPKTRALVSSMLGSSAAQPPVNRPADGTGNGTSGPPRLGTMMQYVQAASGTPPELVGKLVVARIAPGSVAERAGMKEADVVLEIGGKAISSGTQMIGVLDALQRDVDVDVVVSRNDQIMKLTARF